MKTYTCSRCKEEWDFIASDYKYNKKKYPTICPLCEMSIIEAIKDTYDIGGIMEVIDYLFKRLI